MKTLNAEGAVALSVDVCPTTPALPTAPMHRVFVQKINVIVHLVVIVSM